MLLENLPHLATAKKRKRSSDGMVGSIDSFDDVVFVNMPCWQQAASDRTVAWWSQRGVDITHSVFFSDDPGVDENCVLIINGWQLDVKSFAEPDDSVGLGVLWRVMTQRTKRFKE